MARLEAVGQHADMHGTLNAYAESMHIHALLRPRAACGNRTPDASHASSKQPTTSPTCVSPLPTATRQWLVAHADMDAACTRAASSKWHTTCRLLVSHTLTSLS